MFRMAADDLFDLDELDEIINSIQTGRMKILRGLEGSRGLEDA